MLEKEGVRPEKLGYDRPSEKLIAFMGKHYGLKRYVPQNNNYVVYSAYFDAQAETNSNNNQANSRSQRG